MGESNHFPTEYKLSLERNSIKMGAKEKNKEINKSFHFILFIIVLLSLALGITMVLSASSPSSLSQYGNSYHFVERQLIAAIIGIILMLIISKIDYKKYAKWANLLYIFSTILLLLVLVPGLSKPANGANRWIKIPIFGSLQPSEIAKLGLIIFCANYLTVNKKNLKSLWKGFFALIILLLIPLSIILIIQSHLSATLIIVLVMSAMMIVAGCRSLYFTTFGTTGATVAAVGMYIMAKVFGKGSFRLERLVSFMDPWKDVQGSGWQIVNSLYAIGSGGLFGVGLRKQQTKIFLHIRTT